MKKGSKKHKLLGWMRGKKLFSTHEVGEWGIRNYCNGANRLKRQFVEEGFVKKLSIFDKQVRGVNSKEAYYEYVCSEQQPKLF